MDVAYFDRIMLLLCRRFHCTWDQALGMDAECIRALRTTGEMVG